jgi:hypothetical protein
MRRRLITVGVCAGVVLLLAVGFLLTSGSLVSNPIVSGLAFGLAILAFVVGLLAMIFAIVLPLFGTPQSFLRRPALDQAIAEGRSGLARVVWARPTGAQINGKWVYDVDLIVDGTRVPAYTTRDRIRIHRSDGTLRGGEILSVVRIAADGPAVTVIAGPRQTPQDALVPQEAPPWS